MRFGFLRLGVAGAVGRGCDVLTFGAFSAEMSGTMVAVPVEPGDFPNTIAGALAAAAVETGAV